MSHELDFSTGSAAIAYRGEVPWHGYGETISPNDSLADIQKKAGLDWRVERSPAFFEVPDENGDSMPVRFDNRVILYRTDNNAPLDMVSESNYKVRQPEEILGFFKELTLDGEFQIEVAGALQEGKKIWALASRADGAKSIGKDLIKPYLLLVDSYDGTYATTARWTSVRVVCQNTLTFSRKDAKTQVKRRHSQSFNEFDISKMHEQLGEFDAGFAEYIARMQEMAKIKVSDEMATRFFAKLYAPEAFDNIDLWDSKSDLDFDKEGVTTNAKNNVAALLDAFHNSPGMDLPSAQNTLFGALQSVTYYQDHEARTKGNKRWESATIGNGYRTKNDAFDLADSLVNA